MSVWAGYQGGISLPPGTPNIEIHPTPTGAAVVINGQQPPAYAGQYTDCHRWVQNTYRLTSTMMIPVYDAYAAMKPPEPDLPLEVLAAPLVNKYRKPGK